jgi:hypothetical protein
MALWTHNFRRAVFVAAISGLLAAAGCTRPGMRPREYADELSATAKQFRAADERGLSGVDARAREIERSLGVR